jgi:hypothetical protein
MKNQEYRGGGFFLLLSQENEVFYKVLTGKILVRFWG